MQKDVNNVTFTGTIAKDATNGQLPTGLTYSIFPVTIQGGKKPVTVKCATMNKVADAMKNYAKKGNRIMIINGNLGTGRVPVGAKRIPTVQVAFTDYRKMGAAVSNPKPRNNSTTQQTASSNQASQNTKQQPANETNNTSNNSNISSRVVKTVEQPNQSSNPFAQKSNNAQQPAQQNNQQAVQNPYQNQQPQQQAAVKQPNQQSNQSQAPAQQSQQPAVNNQPQAQPQNNQQSQQPQGQQPIENSDSENIAQKIAQGGKPVSLGDNSDLPF